MTHKITFYPWRIKYLCVDGGHGWGKTGNTSVISGILATHFDDVIRRARIMMPGGWEIVRVERLDVALDDTEH